MISAKSKKILIIGAIAVVGIGGWLVFRTMRPDSDAHISDTASAEEPDRKVTRTIESGETFGYIADEVGVDAETRTAILSATKETYDLASIRVGRDLEFYFNHDTGDLKKIIYQINSEETLAITAGDSGWQAKRQAIPYEVRQKTLEGSIQSSLYETALENNWDTRVIISLAETFAWQIDFALDIRVGDSFKMIYEERYLDGQYVMPGKILAAKFTNNGKEFRAYYFASSESDDGYYDTDGQSVQKILLKSPLQYRYISSGFTGARIDPINGHTTSHRAIDFAAAYGTPAVTVGDGTVLRSGWNGGYGLSVDVRHNEAYTTRYGHFSRLAVKAGQKVKQGQIVGYVGSTGHSTGPHLHYELHKFGTPVNPFTEELPPTEGLAADLLPAFQEAIAKYNI